MMMDDRARRAFTLVEMLVVVAIVVLLIGILIPTLSYAKEQSRVSATRSILGNVSVAIEAYRSEWGTFPRGSASGSTGRYNMNILTWLLAGWRPASRDGFEGPGFKVNAESRVFGPYYYNASHFKIYAAAADFPNPKAAAAVQPSGGTEAHVDNAAYLDAWGSPIFYMVGYARLDNNAGSGPRSNLIHTDWAASIFQLSNPDVTDHTIASGTTQQPRYVVDGTPIASRLVPYTPENMWDVNKTPRGVGWRVSSGAANPIIGIEFRRLIGQTDLTQENLGRNERILGHNSYLIYSPGKDRQYYTADDLIGAGE